MSLRPGAAPDADHHEVDGQFARRPCRRRSGRRRPHRRPVALGAGDLDAGLDLDAPLLERLHDDVGGVLVDAGQDLGQRLEDGDVAADVAQERGELAADGAAADDRHPGRHLVDVEDVVGAEDPLAVEVEPREAAGARPGGQHQRLGAGDLGAAITGIGVDPEGAGGGVDHACPSR